MLIGAFASVGHFALKDRAMGAMKRNNTRLDYQ